jgi:hypothetical protein
MHAAEMQNLTKFGKRNFGDSHRACCEWLFFGHTGLWRFAEKGVSQDCWKVRFLNHP